LNADASVSTTVQNVAKVSIFDQRGALKSAASESAERNRGTDAATGRSG
jgi:hypothetical protein